MSVVRIPAPLLAGLIAVSALVCAALALLLLGGHRRDEKDGLSAAELSAEFAPLPITNDELFLPAEPDFLPKLIRSREQRTEWTEVEATPFWTDPAGLDPKPLGDAASAAVDGLLETVP